MAYLVECKSCGKRCRGGSQRRGAKLSDLRCICGGELRRIGWREMNKEREAQKLQRQA